MAPSPRPVPVWRKRAFLPLWSGLLVSNLGDWITYVAMYALVYRQTQSPLAVVALRLIHIVPELLFATFAGVFVDRWSRKRTLIVSPLSSAVVVAVLVFVHPVALIFAAEVALTIAGIVFNPAVSAAIPTIVEPEELIQANTLAQTTSTLATLVGGLVGGILVTNPGAAAAFGVDAVSFLVIAVLISTVRLREESRPPSVTSIGRELLEGMCFLRAHPLVATVVGAGAVFVFAPSTVFTVGVVFAQSVLHAGAAGYGLLLAGLGAGSLGAAVCLVLVRARPRADLTFAVTGTAQGAAFILMGRSHFLALATGLYSVAGFMTMINGVSAVTLVQRLVPDQLRGRVFGVASALGHLAAFVSAMFAAGGATLLGTADLISASGVVVATTGLWVLGALPLSERAVNRARMR